MKKISVTQGAAFLAWSLLTSAAPAAVVDFSGTMTATASVSPSGACAPLPFQGIISNGIGSSSFGSFNYSHTACLAGGVGPVNGSFLVDFGTDGFQGIFAGAATASGTPGLFNQIFNYTITGGTGRFLDATGGFIGTGTVDTRNPPPQIAFTFAAVPEPGTWAMMLLGFGLVGIAIRRRRPEKLAQQA